MGETNWLDILPALVGTAAGAFGGPKSALGNGGLGFTQAYVGQIMKSQEEDKAKKNAFESLMTKSAWDNFQKLDGVDLADTDLDPSIRSQVMDYSNKVKEAVQNDGFINAKEATQLNALWGAIAPSIEAVKAKQGAQRTATAGAAGEGAGVRGQMMQAFPGGGEQQREDVWASHPDIKPALDTVEGAQLGPVGVQSGGYWREQAAQDTLRQRRQIEMYKNQMIPYKDPETGQVSYQRPDKVLGATTARRGQDLRSQDSRARDASREAMMMERLDRLVPSNKLSMADMRAKNAWIHQVQTMAFNNQQGSSPEAQQAALAQAVKSTPLVLSTGPVDTSSLWQEMGQSMASPITPELINRLKQKRADGEALTPEERATLQKFILEKSGAGNGIIDAK